jgi:hypothetical protein
MRGLRASPAVSFLLAAAALVGGAYFWLVVASFRLPDSLEQERVEEEGACVRIRELVGPSGTHGAQGRWRMQTLPRGNAIIFL